MLFFNNWENTCSFSNLPFNYFFIKPKSSLSLSKHFSQLFPVALGCQMSPTLVDLLSPELVGCA